MFFVKPKERKEVPTKHLNFARKAATNRLTEKSCAAFKKRICIFTGNFQVPLYGKANFCSKLLFISTKPMVVLAINPGEPLAQESDNTFPLSKYALRVSFLDNYHSNYQQL